MRHRLKLCTVLLVVASLSVSVGAVSFVPSSEIVVYGDASIVVVPDRAIVQMAVITVDETTSDEHSQNAAKVDAVKKALQSIGISDIETASFHVDPVESIDAQTQALSTRYDIEHILQVTTEAGRVGEVIDIARRAGVSRIVSVRFDVSEGRNYQDELIEMAYKDAVARAHAMARVAGLKVLYPTLIEEQGGTYMLYSAKGANGMTVDAPYVPTDIRPRQQELSLRLRVVFAAQPLP